GLRHGGTAGDAAQEQRQVRRVQGDGGRQAGDRQGEGQAHRDEHPVLADPVGEPAELRRARRAADRPGRGHAAGQAVAAGPRGDQQHGPEPVHGHRHPADDPRDGEPPGARDGEDLRVRREEPARPAHADARPASARHRVPLRQRSTEPEDTLRWQPVFASATLPIVPGPLAPAAYQATGRPWLDGSMPAYDAFLLLSFGGPEGPDDVLPFLENVTRGRGVPQERLAAVAEHYYAYGGVSPINAQNRELLKSIGAAFAEAGIDLPLYWGNRNWQPFIEETVRQLKEGGARRVIAFVTSAYSSYSACRQYLDDIDRAVAAAGPDAPRIDKVRPYFNHPGFIEPFAA